MSRFALFLVGMLTALGFQAQGLKPKDEAAIREVFQQQQDCWNKGDIDCFMEGYWKDEGTDVCRL